MAGGWFRALEALAGCAAAGAGGRSPSDCPLAGLSQEEIERLEREEPRLDDILPLSPLQEGLLFHALYDAQAPDVYTVQLELALAGALDAARLEAAVQALVARHASLRAGFRHAGLSRPVQIIAPPMPVPVRRIDLSALDAAERAARLADILAEDRRARFDLAAPPLMRLTLVRLAPAEHRLVLANHHLLMDGWSTPVLVQELVSLYAADADPDALPRVTPYRDYLAFIAAQDRPAAIAAWREALAGLDEGTRLAPPDRARAPVAPEQVALALDAPLTAALTGLARRRGLTLNTLIQAAWAILLGRLTGRDDVVFGVTVAGRPPEIAGIERMVGLFINTLPLRIRLAPATPLAELLEEVQDRQSRLMAHPYLGLAEIQQLAGRGRAVRHADRVRELSGGPGRPGGGGGRGAVRPGRRARCDALSVEPCGHAGGAARAAAVLSAGPVRSGERGGAGGTAGPPAGGGGCGSRAADRGARHSERRRAPHASARLERDRARDPRGKPAGAGGGAGGAQRRTRWRWWARTESLSYGELEARANRLAHHLRRRGVGPETVVGLCVARSPAMVVGLLGILKAGGAYLPLDPGYPPERLAFMLADARAAVLVSEDSPRSTFCRPSTPPLACCSTPTPRPSPHARRPRRRSPSTRTTPPMSSTPPAPPEPRKASSSRMRQCHHRLVARRSSAVGSHPTSCCPPVRVAQLRCRRFGDLATRSGVGRDARYLARSERSDLSDWSGIDRAAAHHACDRCRRRCCRSCR